MLLLSLKIEISKIRAKTRDIELRECQARVEEQLIEAKKNNKINDFLRIHRFLRTSKLFLENQE